MKKQQEKVKGKSECQALTIFLNTFKWHWEMRILNCLVSAARSKYQQKKKSTSEVDGEEDDWGRGKTERWEEEKSLKKKGTAKEQTRHKNNRRGRK